MRVGGNHRHGCDFAQACAGYANIGYELMVCTDINAESGRDFANRYGCQFVDSYEDGLPPSAR